MYHPQTDRLSERTNQTVETALRIFCNHQLNDWVEWLPLIQYQINSHENSTTKRVPFEVWMGYTPRAHQPLRESRILELEERRGRLKEIREAAVEEMAQAQQSWIKETRHHQYELGERVWLEGKNLTTFHPNAKL